MMDWQPVCSLILFKKYIWKYFDSQVLFWLLAGPVMGNVDKWKISVTNKKGSLGGLCVSLCLHLPSPSSVSLSLFTSTLNCLDSTLLALFLLAVETIRKCLLHFFQHCIFYEFN